MYALDEVIYINDRETPIHGLSAFVGTLLGVDIRDYYSACTDMKRRKNESRTYFLDKMQERLDKDDEQEKKICYSYGFATNSLFFCGRIYFSVVQFVFCTTMQV